MLVLPEESRARVCHAFLCGGEAPRVIISINSGISSVNSVIGNVNSVNSGINMVLIVLIV